MLWRMLSELSSTTSTPHWAIDFVCPTPEVLKSELTMEVRIHADGRGLLIKTLDADRFYLALNRIALNGVEIESVAPADDDANSVYEYLIGTEEVVR